jgi:hypothetical protein
VFEQRWGTAVRVCVAGEGTVGTTASNECVIGMSQHTSVEPGMAVRVATDQRCKQSLTVQFPPLSKHTAFP